MSVHLAASVFRRKVAIGLSVCEHDLKLTDLKGSGATGEFLAGIGDVFDTMNSKYTFKKGPKAPMSIENEEEWSQRFNKFTRYIHGLRHDTGQLLIEGARKNCWLGWLANMISLRHILDVYVKTGMTDCIKVYRLSQDPLESFFGSMRAALGGNNNPTVLQFKGAYQRLCAGALLKSGKGANVVWDNELKLLRLQAARQQQLELDEVFQELWLDKHLSVELRGLNIEDRSDFCQQVLTYISGASLRKVSERLNCENCVQFLRCGPNILTCSLIERLDRGGLVRPVAEAVTLVKVVEAVVIHESKCRDIIHIPNIYHKLMIKSKICITETKPTLLDSLCDDPSHKLLVIDLLIKHYLSARLGHMVRQFNQGMKANSRHRGKKIPIFNHE